MRILALETSGLRGSIALVEDAELVRQQMLPRDSRSAQSLAPTIQSVFAEAGWSLGGVDLIAVTEGPGSFTGLRIGITTAKALAYAADSQVMGVNTLEVVARQTPLPAVVAGPATALPSVLWAVLDAQRGELFAASFLLSHANRWMPSGEVRIVGRSAWLAQLAAHQAVSGPGLEQVADEIPTEVVVIAREFWFPMAAMVGQLAYEQFLAGRRDELFGLSPKYFRQAAAEEKRRLRPPLG
ncbi:MAG TPA: tRNA (adenosine(37)-N6)-threonylcarbamoyltransferase complex dimerization subunit type 1 TsaB [Pirellulales bacterium]|nr:tRNA (adenosine(37)-N6)-threonylcarbamoyltransferase complex dimerization subunit type 1 TsaB [Pirellulales bacterium]